MSSSALIVHTAKTTRQFISCRGINEKECVMCENGNSRSKNRSVQNCCVSLLSMQICDVLVAMVVLVVSTALSYYSHIILNCKISVWIIWNVGDLQKVKSPFKLQNDVRERNTSTTRSSSKHNEKRIVNIISYQQGGYHLSQLASLINPSCPVNKWFVSILANWGMFQAKLSQLMEDD